MTAVTRDDWSVSYTTGDGVNGAILNVVRWVDPRDLTSKRLRGDHDKRQFPSVAAASTFALERGYLQVYRRRAWSGAIRTDRSEVWPHVSEKAWKMEQARRIRALVRRLP